MAAITRDRIDRWLGELLATMSQGDGLGIVLVHAAVDQTQRIVKSWKLGDAVENLDALVTEVDEIAEGDAEGLGGRQRYVLRAQLKGKEVGSLTLRYEFRPDDGPAVDSEPATPAGTIAVLQRHAEGAMRMMVQSFGGVIESYKDQVNAQKALIADFQRQAAENFRLQEELASKKIEQQVLLQERQTQLQITAAREANEIEKSQMIWVHGMRELFQWAPVAVYYMTKGQAGVAPDQFMEAKRRAAEDELFASATDATIEQWRKSLTPEEFASLMERLKAYRAAHGAKAGAQPAQSASDVDDAVVAAASARFYAALVGRADVLESLAFALLSRRLFSALSPQEKLLVEELAAETANGDGALAAEALWAALAGRDPATLAPLVAAVKTQISWAKVGVSEKVQLMSVVRRAFETSGATGATGAHRNSDA